MLTSKSRFVIGIEGTPVVIRFVPSRNDPAKVALKAAHPEAIALFLALGGITTSESIRGRHFFITEIGRAELLAALPVIFAKVLEANVPTADAPVAPVEDPTAAFEDGDEPSGSPDLFSISGGKAD